MKTRIMTSLYLIRGEEILFLYRIGSKATHDSYIATAGGHVENDEMCDPTQSVLRELKEETGLSIEDLEGMRLRYISMRNTGQELRQIYYYFATLKNSDRDIKSNEGNLSWINMNDCLKLDMPLTAKEVVQHYISVGKDTDLLYGAFVTKDATNMVEFLES